MATHYHPMNKTLTIKFICHYEKNYIAISEVFHVSHSAHGGRGVVHQNFGAIVIRHSFQLGPALETLHGQIYLKLFIK
jgi:hypothetical protein